MSVPAGTPTGTPTARAAILEARAITKRFSGITALDDITLDVAPGEVVGLIGPNGAGKTTFFNCLLGMLRPDAGAVHFDGRDRHRTPRLQAGPARDRTHLPAPRALLGHDRPRALPRHRTGPQRHRPTLEGSSEPLQAHRGGAGPRRPDARHRRPPSRGDKPVESLSLGRGRLVELGRALMTQPKLLLLDEPSSGLDVKETAGLADKLAAVQAEHEFAVLLVEHDVEMVSNLVTRLYVFDFGELIAGGPTAEVLGDERSARPTSGTWCERLQRPRRAGAPAGAADPGAMRRRGQLRAVPVPVRHLVLDRPGGVTALLGSTGRGRRRWSGSAPGCCTDRRAAPLPG